MNKTFTFFVEGVRVHGVHSDNISLKYIELKSPLGDRNVSKKFKY